MGSVVGMAFKGHEAGDPEAVEKQVPEGVGLAIASRDIIEFVKSNGVAVSTSRQGEPLPSQDDSLVRSLNAV